MKIIETIQDIREHVRAWRTEGLTVGFVPTMGCLHEGHQSLIRRAAQENDRVIVSIFVNPMQFGKNEDFDRYPRNLQKDSELCAAEGADLIFHPDHEEMYGADFCSFVDMNGLTATLCGKSRPDHFRGVCTVVMKLFNIVKPDRAYFGQKDAQQVAVVKRMVLDLNMDVEVISCETVREADGLAKSSRNIYLDKEQRRASVILSEALQCAERKISAGVRTSVEILKTIQERLESESSVELDYAEIVDLETLKPICKIEAPALIAAAIYVGKTRLIDNFIVS